MQVKNIYLAALYATSTSAQNWQEVAANAENLAASVAAAANAVAATAGSQ